MATDKVHMLVGVDWLGWRNVCNADHVARAATDKVSAHACAMPRIGLERLTDNDVAWLAGWCNMRMQWSITSLGAHV